MKPIIVANWKANDAREILKDITDKYKNIEISIAPSYVHLSELKKTLPESISLTAQDCSRCDVGSYTGEVPSCFLKDAGVKYVIIGHSERRMVFNETSNILSEKVNRALAAGLRVIYCVGEDSDIRYNKGYLKFIYDQFFSVIGQNIEIDICYEPVWSIGTGILPKVEEVEEVIGHIRKWSRSINIKGRILYGGSINSETISKFNGVENLDGFLVGGASLKSDFITLLDNYDKEIGSRRVSK